jgi:hypothetical protein
MALGLFGPLGSTALCGSPVSVVPPPPVVPPYVPPVVQKLPVGLPPRKPATLGVVTPYWPYGQLSEREQERLRRKRLKKLQREDDELLVTVARMLLEEP